MLATKISPLYVAAASNLLRFCRVCHRVAAVSPPVSVVFPTDGWQSLVKTPSLPHLELLRRSFAIESSVASLLAFPAALFTAIDRSGHHESGGTFSIAPKSLSFNGFVFYGSGTQIAEAGNVEAYVHSLYSRCIFSYSLSI